MGKIFLTSDLHFGHDREFLWGPRGFRSGIEHDEAVIANWNEVIGEDDDVYVLGDLMLGDSEWGCQCVRRLNGRIHLVRGNHDTDRRWFDVYPQIPNIVEYCGWATMIKYNKLHFYLSHFPTSTSNIETESLYQTIINLSGHTHQKDKFREDIPMYYNVALDAHHNTPVCIDDIIEDILQEIKKCKEYL